MSRFLAIPYTWSLAVGAFLLSLGVLFLGFVVDRSNFWQVFIGFSLAFAGYLAIVRVRMTNHKHRKRRLLLPLVFFGLLLRLLLLFAFPLLSDDVYRFIWDGHLLRAGINPLSNLPAYYMEAEQAVGGLTPDLFALLNSPEYYTIYPPLAQAVFTVATSIAPNSWWGSAVLMKLFLLAAEIGTFYLLWQLLKAWSMPRERLLLYWLNPLILVEIMGNLHFEGAMIMFLLLALWALIQARWWLAGAAFALSVASKLLPLMFLPFLIVRLWRRGRSQAFWYFSMAFGGLCLLLFAPLLATGLSGNFGSSLELYFRKFEFNASLYYIAREIGYQQTGWNQIAVIGPALARGVAVFILLFAWVEALYRRSGANSWRIYAKEVYRKLFPSSLPLSRLATSPIKNKKKPVNWQVLPSLWLFAFVVYLLGATTVHPWYLSLPIVLCCFSSWRFPLVWSFFIVLTYTNYTTVPYQENLYLLVLEYALVVLFFVYEAWKRGKEWSGKLKAE